MKAYLNCVEPVTESRTSLLQVSPFSRQLSFFTLFHSHGSSAISSIFTNRRLFLIPLPPHFLIPPCGKAPWKRCCSSQALIPLHIFSLMHLNREFALMTTLRTTSSRSPMTFMLPMANSKPPFCLSDYRLRWSFPLPWPIFFTWLLECHTFLFVTATHPVPPWSLLSLFRWFLFLSLWPLNAGLSKNDCLVLVSIHTCFGISKYHLDLSSELQICILNGHFGISTWIPNRHLKFCKSKTLFPPKFPSLGPSSSQFMVSSTSCFPGPKFQSSFSYTTVNMPAKPLKNVQNPVTCHHSCFVFLGRAIIFSHMCYIFVASQLGLLMPPLCAYNLCSARVIHL